MTARRQPPAWPGTPVTTTELAGTAGAFGARQDAAELLALIGQLGGTRPRTVVETGTERASALWLLSQLADDGALVARIGPPAPGADPEPGGWPELSRAIESTGRWVRLLPAEPDVVRARRTLEEALGGRTVDLLFLDGEPGYYERRADFLAYSPLVADGGVIVLADVGPGAGGPGSEVDLVWGQLRRALGAACVEVTAPGPGMRTGAFGVIAWDRHRRPDLDPAPDGSGFSLPLGQAAAPLAEPVVEVDTEVGPLLLPERDRVITPTLLDTGVWEPLETDFFWSLLGPGQTFVDLGAHVGYFTLLAADQVGPTGTVIAFEPEPRNLALLYANVRAHGRRNVRIVPFAAHRTRGWMSLELNEDNRGAHRLVEAGPTEVVVRCVRPDDVLPPRVDVVKIDVQGYDHDAVAGLEATIAANPDLVIVVEISARSWPTGGSTPPPSSPATRPKDSSCPSSTRAREPRRMAAVAIAAAIEARPPPGTPTWCSVGPGPRWRAPSDRPGRRGCGSPRPTTGSSSWGRTASASTT